MDVGKLQNKIVSLLRTTERMLTAQTGIPWFKYFCWLEAKAICLNPCFSSSLNYKNEDTFCTVSGCS